MAWLGHSHVYCLQFGYRELNHLRHLEHFIQLTGVRPHHLSRKSYSRLPLGSAVAGGRPRRKNWMGLSPGFEKTNSLFVALPWGGACRSARLGPRLCLRLSDPIE